MTPTRVLIIGALCVVLCLVLGAAVAPVYAASADQDLAQKTGISGSLATTKKKEDDGKGPSKLQMAVGVGSIFVMIAVVKWL